MLSDTCYVSLIILRMAFINVEWEPPNGATVVQWTRDGGGGNRNFEGAFFMMFAAYVFDVMFCWFWFRNSVFLLSNLHKAVLR